MVQSNATEVPLAHECTTNTKKLIFKIYTIYPLHLIININEFIPKTIGVTKKQFSFFQRLISINGCDQNWCAIKIPSTSAVLSSFESKTLLLKFV